MQKIYEDDNLLAANKPAGENFYWALKERPELLIVHRLDKETSGVILFAKNEKAQEYLRDLFKSRLIQKSYKVLVVGKFKDNSGRIELSIGRSKKTPLKRVAIGEKRGTIREALTEYKVIKRFNDFTFVEALPKTGRTHQIRSHFAAIGHPLACDRLYAGKRFICPRGLGRHFLHAAAVELTLPTSLSGGSFGGRVRLEAGIASDLAIVLEKLSSY